MIYDYQKATYESLLRACWSHQRTLDTQLEVKTRPHRLILGSTGSGKTHLAMAVCESLNWDVMLVNASAWVLTGARGTPTWDSVRDWISESSPRRPRCLILDELDKTDGSSDWCRMLRTELFSILDGRPVDAAEITSSIKERLSRLMIIGCGAFQDCFDEKPAMGFCSDPITPPKQGDLHKHMQRELVNRFHQGILTLPTLTDRDYAAMARQVINTLPVEAQSHANKIYERELALAIEGKIGARFPESLVSTVFDSLTKDETPTPWKSYKLRDLDADEIPDISDAEFDPWTQKVPITT